MKKIILIAFLWIVGVPAFAQEAPRPAIEFQPASGFYNESIEVTLQCIGAQIYYTLDGSKPTRRARLYKQPFSLSNTTVVRAIAYLNGEHSTFSASTYFIREPETNFPIVSIGVTPRLLFDTQKGLFMQGTFLTDTVSWKMPGANFWSYKEVPAHIEIFESNGESVYNSLSGLRLFGGMSRLFPQKSMTLVARERYGAKRFEHPIFGAEGLNDFKFLVLRNSGSDWGKTHFRDALMTGLLDEWDMDKQSYRPSHVYINGKYWGIYNIREKINRYFIADHNKGVHKDSIDFLEHNMIRRRGSDRHYKNMIDFVTENNLRNPTNYAYLQTLMDVDNFMNYQIAQIYFDNQDAGGNIKYWRPRTPEGRWRWIMYDTDWGFGLHEDDAYHHNSLAFHTEPNGPTWPNPAWSTFLLRKLLENPDFEQAFVNRFADHLNITFNTERVEESIEKLHKNLFPEMHRHLKRWRLSPRVWKQQVDVLHAFAQERPLYTRMHLMDRFNTGAIQTLQVSNTGGGTVLVNDYVKVNDQPFEGKYFENIPVTVKVIPQNGYRFSHWEGIAAAEDMRELTLQLKQETTTIRAVFEKFEHPLAGKIILNEISANNRKAGDWVEIYNQSNEDVKLDGWMLTDLKNEFVFPAITIPPNDYVVICQDTKLFYAQFPTAYNVIDGLNFGLNKRAEQLQLFASYGAMVDSVFYELPPTDSIFTLSLLLPNLNNSDTENWEIRYGKGSPNAPNPYFLESSVRTRQKQWLEIGLAASILVLGIFLLVLRQRRVL